MKQSENYRFALPTAEDDTLADIGVISENFKTVDRVMKKNENLEFELTKFEGETMDAVGRLNKKDTELQSQINMLSGVDMSEFQAQLDNKSDATNLVNGSATGSLRGVNTREEDDEYTMGEYAVAEGHFSAASGDNAHAEGFNTTASGIYSHAEGLVTIASNNCSHAEGWYTTASGVHSHAEGKETTASGDVSHVEGKKTTASGLYSHAEGLTTIASNDCSHAEGWYTTASGEHSHAEGKETTASGVHSHAEGNKTTASGGNSHAEGCYTIASGDGQHVQGRYNIEDTNNKYAHIVGNGTEGWKRSNAHTLDWDGNAWFAGDVLVGGASQDDENAINLVNISTKNKTDIEGLKAKEHTLYQAIADLTARIETLENSASS